MSGYTFGDSDLAAARLAILDAIYAPTSDAMLAALDAAPLRVVDLGCGPGATTARLVKRFPEATVLGIDASPSFVATAMAGSTGATFTIADVTEPLPSAPFDLVYARFLLAHLADVKAALQTWVDALAPRGSLILEETGIITSDDTDFARYEQLTSARVRDAGACVYAGPLIVGNLPDSVEIISDRELPIDLTAGQAAGMFWRNLATWGAEAVADGHLTEAERATLLARLQARESDPTRGLFTWTHHQTVARRR